MQKKPSDKRARSLRDCFQLSGSFRVSSGWGSRMKPPDDFFFSSSCTSSAGGSTLSLKGRGEDGACGDLERDRGVPEWPGG